MDEPITGYRSFVLRLWQERPYQAWRVGLQAVPGDEWRMFASLEGVFAYLTKITAVAADDADLPMQDGA